MDPDKYRDSTAGTVMWVPTQPGYWAFVPNPLPPEIELTRELVLRVSEADRALGELAGLGRVFLNPHLLIVPFIRREAVLSSRIEGTRTTLSELYRYEAVQMTMFSPEPDVREVLNYVRALEYGLHRLQEFPLSLRLVREIHGHLMEGVRGESQTPGEFRHTPNWIGPYGSNLNTAPYVPPPVQEMHQALGDLERYLYAEPQLPHLIRLGLIHYQFEAIHPFLDGNGRIGRLLIVLLLCAWELLPQPLLYLSAFFQTHRDDYLDLLSAVSQSGAWHEWLDFFLTGVITQARDAVIRTRRLQDIREYYRDRFQKDRKAARLLGVVDYLFERPILTTSQIQKEQKVSFGTAQKYVAQLEDAGLLREITGQARNRVYQADQILQILEEPLDRAG